jgi:hypothetical protein
MTIGGGMVAGDAASRGKTIIIVSTGSVTITGNITYKSPAGSDVFTSINQIPQVVIVARNINIEGSVRRIDAWLQTTGTAGSINTCSDVPVSANLTVGNCADTLQMNGPISTAHLHLRRTAGAENADRAGNPAEIINLRADAYLWAQRWGAESGKALTVYTNELPPRF